MTMLALGSFLLGAVFGRFFKVWILLPVSAVLFAIACANFAILEFAVLSICLQAGYASGLLSCIIHDLWLRRKNHANPRVRSRQATARHPQLFSNRGTIDKLCWRAAESGAFLSFEIPPETAQFNGVTPSLIFVAASL